MTNRIHKKFLALVLALSASYTWAAGDDVKVLKLIPIKGTSTETAPAINVPTPKVEQEIYPGLGVMPGDPAIVRNKSVKAGVDRNEMLYIAIDYANRISTPFLNPQVIDKSDSDIQIVGQDVYIKPVSVKPIALFITDDTARQTISLTLVPKSLPAQTINAVLDNQRAGTEADANVPTSYQGQIATFLQQAAQEKTPPGFTASRLASSVAGTSEVLVFPQIRYSGAVYDIYKYQLVSKSMTTLDLREENFYTDNNIRAIAFSPDAALSPGGSTTLFILKDKPSKGAE